MNRIDYHGLKFQLILVVKLFVICIGVAVYLIYQRPWVESFMVEKYASPPASLQDAIGQIRMKKSIQESYQKIPETDRVLLFDYWMATDPVNRKLAGELIEIDFNLFSQRAERTLVSGSPEQRRKALVFFELGNDRKLIPILEKARRWAERRKLDDFCGEINSTIQQIENQ